MSIMAELNVPSDKWYKWKALRVEFCGNLGRPVYEPSFVLYFIGIMLLGNPVLWLRIFESGPASSPEGQLTPLLQHLLTRESLAIPHELALYFIGLLVATVADVLLEKKSNQTSYLLTFFIALIAFYLGIVCFRTESWLGSYAAAFFGFAVTLFLWWTANADNERLRDRLPPPETAIAGDARAELHGDLNGIEA
jgi:hypothetical protein